MNRLQLGKQHEDYHAPLVKRGDGSGGGEDGRAPAV